MVQTITESQHVPFASQPDSKPTMLDFAPPFRRVDVVDELERKVGQALPDLDSGGMKHLFHLVSCL